MLKVDVDLDLVNIYIIVILLVLLLLYVFADVNYFLRVAFTIVHGRLFQDNAKVDGATEITGFCTTNDMDLFLNHMNNARYIREADFGRFHFFDRTGLYKTIIAEQAHIMQGACNIRYRKPIPIFTMFKVTTKVIYWDDKHIYFEQQFITNDNFIRAILISQNKLLNMNVSELMAKFLKKDADYRVEPPEELKLWIKSIEASSNRLRKKE